MTIAQKVKGQNTINAIFKVVAERVINDFRPLLNNKIGTKSGLTAKARNLIAQTRTDLNIRNTRIFLNIIHDRFFTLRADVHIKNNPEQECSSVSYFEIEYILGIVSEDGVLMSLDTIDAVIDCKKLDKKHTRSEQLKLVNKANELERKLRGLKSQILY